MDAKINQLEIGKINPKKRVLFIITQSELGGAQKFLAQLIRHLDTLRFEVVLATGQDGNEEIRAILPENTHFVTLKKLHRNPNIINDISSIFELKKLIMELRPDTVFLNSSKAGFNGSLAVKMLPPNVPHPKVIYRIGGWTFNDPWPWWKRLAYRWLEKLSAGWKDRIIVNNKHDYEQALKYKICPRQKVVLIHNGIDPYKLELLEKNEAKIRLYEKLPSDQKHANFLHKGLVIGTIANFYPTKGLEYLVDAFKIIETYHLSPITYNLVLIGDGPERENLKSRIKNLGLENKIILTGRIPDAHKHLNAFDIFVLPSVKEGFPWALLEAMSAKLPVIATTVGANPEIIENKKNGLLVAPRSPQDLADALQKLISDDALRRELGIQAHQTVLHRFSLSKMIESVENIL